MSQVGDVQHADVLMENRRSKGCGIVTYVREEDAARAIQVLNDTDLNGRQIFVREDREAAKPSTRRTQHADSNTRVYVGNLSFRVAWQDLKDYMKQAGEISYADVLQDSNGRSRGCGLVEYARAEDAQTAIETLHDTELHGRLIFVREDREPDRGSISSVVRRSSGGNGRGRNQRRSGGDSSNSMIRISNLPAETTWQDLKDLCKTVGYVDRVEIAQHPDGSSKGYGTVRFRSKEDANAALDELDRTDFGGREIEVIFENNE